MTPYEIGILLHYYASNSTDAPELKRGAPILAETIETFIARNLLERTDRADLCLPAYRLTERGRIYVEALQRVPLPERGWVVPIADLNALLQRMTE